MDFAAAYAGRAPALVDFQATVTGEPSYFMGMRTKCTHERFGVQTACGPAEIVDNVALAPRVPVHAGDRIEVRGIMVHDPGREPIVHWTHHDPAHRHPDGFIRLHGRTYA
ncbi:MAG: DUF3465 domain-containing protein [bacterium]|nr:DUF3465 domain-containing protein [bacterium]